MTRFVYIRNYFQSITESDRDISLNELFESICGNDGWSLYDFHNALIALLCRCIFGDFFCIQDSFLQVFLLLFIH